MASPEEDLNWLTGPDAARWLHLASDFPSDAVSLASRLRKDLSAERTHLTLQQIELRRRAAEKFSLAAQMFFTPRGLEQATDEVVARYKATRFPSADPIADLCCGIGGDLMALAARGPTTGVERDPVTASMARANLGAASFKPPFPLGEGWGEGAPRYLLIKPSRVVVADVADFSLPGFAAWHIDPDRRSAGRRTTRVELHQPSPAVIARLLHQCPSAAIKLAPAAVLDADNGIPWQEAEFEWISRAGQCRQLVAWFGSMAAHPRARRATVLAANLETCGAESLIGSFVGLPDVELKIANRIGRFVFEPDPTVLAARLTGAFSAALALKALSPGVAYLTADEAPSSPLLATFEVLDVLPYRPKALKAWLRARHIGRLEVKKRSLDLDPEQVRRALSVPGDNTATLLLCRVNGKQIAILARRYNGRNVDTAPGDAPTTGTN